MPRDYYDVLGVPRTATQEQIKAAHRRLARQYHPDRNPGDKDAEARFKEVQQAYDVLSDEKKRRAYDQFGPDFAEAGMAGGPRGAGPFTFRWGTGPGGGQFQEFDLNDLGEAQEVFEQFFGGGLRGGRRGGPRGFARPGPAAASAQEQEISVDFLTAARGGSIDLDLARQDQRGRTKHETLTVKIPAGIADGGKLNLRGQGPDGSDLIIRVRIRPHPYFRREGQDLYVDLPISLAEAAFGAKVEAPTLEGMATVTIPPESSSGRLLRLRGKGLPAPGGKATGDQYVRLMVVLPKGLDERSRELIREFSQRHPADPRADVPWRK